MTPLYRSMIKLKKIDPTNRTIKYHDQKMVELLDHYVNEVNAGADNNHNEVCF